MLCELPASKTGKDEMGGQRWCFGRDKSKATETASEEVGDLLTFSKALFRMRLNGAPSGIGRGDGYSIWPTKDETWAWSNFKVLPAGCWSKNFYYGTFWTGKNFLFLSYLQTVLTTLTEYDIKENQIIKQKKFQNKTYET